MCSDHYATTLAGSGQRQRVDGNREHAAFNAPAGVTVYPDGRVLVSH
jgi:hypothetical protein